MDEECQEAQRQEAFHCELLDPSVLSSYFETIPALELTSSVLEQSSDTRDYLELRREQNMNYAEKQLDQGSEAFQNGKLGEALQAIEQGLELVPTHEGLQKARKRLNDGPGKPFGGAVAKSERRIQNAALELAMSAETKKVAPVASLDPEYPLLNDDDDDCDSTRHRKKQSKKKKSKKKKKKKKHRRRKYSSSPSDLSSDADSTSKLRAREDDNVELDCGNVAIDEDDSSRLLEKYESQRGKRKADDSPLSGGTVDSLTMIRSKKRRRT